MPSALKIKMVARSLRVTAILVPSGDQVTDSGKVVWRSPVLLVMN